MRVTAKSEYATRAVLHLAMEYPEVVTIHQIADRHRIPVKYLEQILLELKRGGSSSASAVSMAAIFFPAAQKKFQSAKYFASWTAASLIPPASSVMRTAVSPAPITTAAASGECGPTSISQSRKFSSTGPSPTFAQ